MATKEMSRRGLDDVLTVAQVADYLHLNKLTVYKYIREGRLPAVRLGRTYRVMREDVHRFLNAQRTGSSERTRAVRRVRPAAKSFLPSERTTQDTPEAYVDPQHPEFEPREMIITYNPLDWVIRGLH